MVVVFSHVGSSILPLFPLSPPFFSLPPNFLASCRRPDLLLEPRLRQQVHLLRQQQQQQQQIAQQQQSIRPLTPANHKPNGLSSSSSTSALNSRGPAVVGNGVSAAAAAPVAAPAAAPVAAPTAALSQIAQQNKVSSSAAPPASSSTSTTTSTALATSKPPSGILTRFPLLPSFL